MRSTLTLGVVALLVCICSASVSSPDLSSLALRKMGSAVKTPATLQLRGGMQGKTSAAHSEDSTDVSREDTDQADGAPGSVGRQGEAWRWAQVSDTFFSPVQHAMTAYDTVVGCISADALADILTTLREYPEFMYMNVKTDISSIKVGSAVSCVQNAVSDADANVAAARSTRRPRTRRSMSRASRTRSSATAPTSSS
eukprot:306879-Rhodomonas_salina.2